MRYKKFGLFAAIFALTVSAVNGVIISPSAHAAGQTCAWTGAAGDNTFSTANNWSSCNSSTPQEGDVISIDYGTITNGQALTNDLDTALGGVTLTGQVPSGSYSKYINMNTLQLADGAVVSCSPEGVSCAVYVTIASQSVLGDIHGLGDITLSTRITSRSIQTSGVLTIAKTTYSNHSADTYERLVVQNGSTLYYSAGSAYSTPMTLGGGTGTTNPVIYWGNYRDEETTYVWTSPITLLHNTDIRVASGRGTIGYTGAISGSGYSLSRLSTSEGKFNFNPSSNNTSSVVGAQANATTSVKLTGEDSASVNIYSNETVTLTGQRPYATVHAGGVLKGTGTLEDELQVNINGTVAPGMSPGCLTSDLLWLDGEYEFELGGSVACTGYDQLKVLNAGDEEGAVSIDDETATISTSRYNGYAPKQGDVFVIIDQAGIQPVDGAFSGLDEGATFTENGVEFSISYVGGDGNDVTLTVMNSPTSPSSGTDGESVKAPDTGFKLLLARPFFLFAVMVGAAAGLFAFARKLQTRR